MADDYSTASKFFQSCLQRTQSIYIQIVGWFVQKQDVCANAQCFCQENPVALSSRKRFDCLLLIRTGKIKRSTISPAVDNGITQMQVISTASDFFKNSGFGIEAAHLVSIAEFNCLSQRYRTRIWLN